MAGLLSYQLTPQATSGQFLGDALSGLGAGLLAYGSGGQARNQAGLIGIQGLQDAQQRRAQQAQRELQTQSLTQQLAMQQQQMQAQQQQMQQAGQQQQAYKSFIGGQPFQGPTPSGAPMSGSSPINPALSGLPQSVQQMLPAMDPQQGMGLVAQLATQKPAAQPDKIQEYEYAKQNGFKGSMLDYQAAVAAAGRAPQQPQQLPSDIQEYNLAAKQGFKGGILDYQNAKKGQGFTTTLPDGTVISMGGAQKPVTEAQANAGTRAGMIKDGVSKIMDLYGDPGLSLPRTLAAKAADRLIDPAAGDLIRSSAEQQLQAAQASALEGLASAVTGAGVAKDQFTRYQQMLPNPLTDKDASVRQFKLKMANDFLKGQLIAAGPAGANLAKEIDDAKPSSADSPASKPTKVLNYNPSTGGFE